MTRCLFFLIILGLSSCPAVRGQDASPTWHWIAAHELTVEGQGWQDVQAPFDRLPARAEGVVRPPVWNLSRQSAGLCVRFRTDSPRIAVRWTLTSGNLSMPHMPSSGVSGIDLYLQDDAGKLRWAANGRPSQQDDNQSVLADGLAAQQRGGCLYLPLYNGIRKLEIGVVPNSQISPWPREGDTRPIVFWGTSITQGACASRPGMVHTAILSRRLNRPIINLGFSGNGKFEPEMAELIAELDPAVIVLDCNPNLNADQIRERGPEVLTRLRSAHPQVPILLVEDRTYADAWWNEAKRQRNATNREALRAVYEARLESGDAHLAYLPGANLLGEDDEATVDSSHPTDLGFVRMADAFEPLLTQWLAPPR